MKGKLNKQGDRWVLYNEDSSKIALSTESPFYKLSLKNCEAIERGYDLDELASERLSTRFDENSGYHKFVFVEAYKEGFQKALEILVDKKFSEEDMIKFMQFTISIEELGNTSSVSTSTAKYYLDNFTSNLQQTEWDVEIEMEYKQQLANGYKNQYENVLVPKLDADGCLILKRI